MMILKETFNFFVNQVVDHSLGSDSPGALLSLVGSINQEHVHYVGAY